MMPPPTIQSLGAPPAKHADRVVGEMLHLIIKTQGERWAQIRTITRAGADGNPKAQARLAKKIIDAGGLFVVTAWLSEVRKRGRYVLHVVCVNGWDAARKVTIFKNDPIPATPWLACTHVEMISKGRRVYDDKPTHRWW
jgi:hypothetical protein